MPNPWFARIVALLCLIPPALAHAQNPPVTVNVDATADHAISPLIYGVHFAGTAELLDLNATVNRHGGNSVGRYNWQQDIDNRGSDYFFSAFPYNGGAGGVGTGFINRTKAGGAEPFLSMPMVGWVAKTSGGGGQTWSFSVAKYGAFTGVRGDQPDAGNGCKAGAPLENFHPCGNAAFPFTGNDPNDGSIPAGAAFQQGWMQHVVNTHGPASAGGLRYWGLDNEPSIWHTVYWDVKPEGARASEMRDKMVDYATRIKTVDPGAQVLGPEEWGWDGFFYSGYDQQRWGRNLCQGWNCPDRVAIGGDYVPWLLAEMRAAEIANGGTRLLDMLTLHIYPQGGEVDGSLAAQTTTAMQLKRNRSTRALWDVNYVDESWINTQIRLIPRMREWVAANYPGTKLGLTEYDWGAEGHINGATAEADLLGIFGRENLDMAIRWVVPALNSPVYKAFQMYRNYDGNKKTFGDVSVSASGPNPDEVAAFAATRTSDGALTVMLVAKVLTGATPATVNVTNFNAASPAQVWRLDVGNVITRLADVAVAAGSISLSLPPQTITLLVVPPGGAPPNGVLAVDDVTVIEGTGGATTATFTVTRTVDTTGTATVAYATQAGTATAGSDYTSVSGTLTFAPGVVTRTVGVSIVTDAVDEPSEEFSLVLGPAVSGATIGDDRGTGTITDDDDPPGVLSVADVTVGEAAGIATFTVTRTVDTTGTATVAYATVPGTAVGGSDYIHRSGTLTFTPGMSSIPLQVTILDDGFDEPNIERFALVLGPASGATLGRDRATASIEDDDGGNWGLRELSHGYDDVEPFDVWYEHFYALRQPPYSSWEVMVDGAFGDVSAGAGPNLQRRSAEFAPVQASSPAGVGTAQALRWANDTASIDEGQYVLVSSATCGPCTSNDGYRIRAWDTTGFIPRFNNAGSQVTVILLQNRRTASVDGTVYFWSTAGALLHTAGFSIPPHGLFSLATSSIPALAGASGTVTVTHDGGYGALAGKSVALEPATGFSFDSPMQLR